MGQAETLLNFLELVTSFLTAHGTCFLEKLMSFDLVLSNPIAHPIKVSEDEAAFGVSAIAGFRRKHRCLDVVLRDA
jgi:hypothetical protein